MMVNEDDLKIDSVSIGLIWKVSKHISYEDARLRVKKYHVTFLWIHNTSSIYLDPTYEKKIKSSEGLHTTIYYVTVTRAYVISIVIKFNLYNSFTI